MSTSLVFRKGQGLPSEKCFLLQRSHDLGGVDYDTIAVIGVGHAFAAQAGGAPISWLYPEEPPAAVRPGNLKVCLRDEITREDPPWELRLERDGESTLLAYLSETKLASLSAGLGGYHTGILPSQTEIETLSRKMTTFRIEDLRAEADRLEAEMGAKDTRQEIPENYRTDISGNLTLTCSFTPQKWMGDTAFPIDPEGPSEWRMTTQEAADLSGVDDVIECLGEDTYESDALRNSIHAPQWVKDWTGPFFVSVTTPLDDELIAEEEALSP